MKRQRVYDWASRRSKWFSVELLAPGVWLPCRPSRSSAVLLYIVEDGVKAGARTEAEALGADAPGSLGARALALLASLFG